MDKKNENRIYRIITSLTFSLLFYGLREMTASTTYNFAFLIISISFLLASLLEISIFYFNKLKKTYKKYKVMYLFGFILFIGFVLFYLFYIYEKGLSSIWIGTAITCLIAYLIALITVILTKKK